MTNLAVFCDGTWNTATGTDNGLPAPTNVVRLYNAVAETAADGAEQKTYYHPGVGTDGGLLDKLTGGGTGFGLGRNIMSAYSWLAANYEDGDHVFLFGFSRGAYTVRSLAGLIATCGLLDLRNAQAVGKADWERVVRQYDRYRDWSSDRKRPDAPPPAFQDSVDGVTNRRMPVHFMGVWDTVGSLGIPDEFAILNLLDDPDRHRFHDTHLGTGIRHARHAVAIDEMRSTFVPTLWAEESVVEVGEGRSVCQMWFPGVHGDVGGGYFHAGLSDCALEWMMNEVGAVEPPLALRPEAQRQVCPNPLAILHDSVHGVFKKFYTSPRNVPAIDEASVEQGSVHASACERLRNPPLTQPPYWPAHLLPERGRVVDIFARQLWNFTGLYLEAGRQYRLEAEGQWLDGRDAYGPEGAKRGFNPRQYAYARAAGLERLQAVFRKVSQNREARFIFTRRVPELRWFALVGVVANGEIGSNGELVQHESFPVGRSCTFTPSKPGYLYAFSNDAWQGYGNNRGSVRLKVYGPSIEAQQDARS